MHLRMYGAAFCFITALLFTDLFMSHAARAEGDENTKAGTLTPDLLEELRSSFKMDADTRMRHNAVTNNSIKELALNRGLVAGQDGHFSHKIEFKGITNQKASGRCWLFAGLNTMRPKVIRDKKLPAFEFSIAYLQFWDKMEKSNLFLETMIEMRETSYLDREWALVHEWTMSDGGWWNFVVDLVEKYGVVPQDVMPETHSSENTRTMNTVLDRKLRADAVTIRKMHKEGASVEELRAVKKKALKEIYRFLVINLGEPPAKFEWRYVAKHSDKNDSETAEPAPVRVGKIPATTDVVRIEPQPEGVEPASSVNKDLSPRATYTPKEFYDLFVGVPLRDYVCLYSDPLSEKRKHYSFKRAKNIYGTADMHFINLPIGDLKQCAMKSLVANEPVWFAADVGKDQSTELGLMADDLYDFDGLFGLTTQISRADRIKLRDGGSNHAMVFMGVDVRDDKPVKWLVENSWGDKKGNKGTWTLYDNWFTEHVYTIIINKQHVPGDVMKLFEEEATELPPWYPGAPGTRK